MREQVLRQFFEGRIPASELANDIAGSTEQVSAIGSIVHIRDMETELTVTRPMIISLCDAVRDGALQPEALETIGFALQASDTFIWDSDEDELLADVIADWSCPQVNYPLTIENISRFRAWLTGVEPYPARPTEMATDGHIISIKEKKRT